MSKKNTNRQPKPLFNGFAAEEAKPAKRTRKPSEAAHTPAQVHVPTRLQAGTQIEAAAPRLEEQIAPVTASVVYGNSGAMSLAFRTDEKNWATLRVVDETEPRTWAMEEQMLVKQVTDQLSLALENARLFEATRESQEVATRSEAELRALFAAMTDIIIVLDKEGRYVRVAPTNPSLLVKPPEELIGQLIKDVLPSESAHSVTAAIEEALRTNQTVNVEYSLEINQKELWFEGVISKLNEEQVFLVARDITERKTHEDAIRRRNDYLAAAAEIGGLVTSTLDLNTIFSRAVNLVRERFGFYHAAIFVSEETGFNVILREATGDAGAEMKRRQHSLPVNEKSVVGKATQTGSAVVINNTALSPTHRPNPLLPETRAEAAIPLHVGVRIIGALDIQSQLVDSFTPDDISVLQILADQIAIAIDNARSYELSQQAIKEMREVDRMKSMFLANMSHELRTPLNSIIGFSRVILKGIDGPTSDLQQQDLTAIYNSGQHLLGLINDILDLSKIEAGKMELAFDEVNLTEVINGVMSTVVGLVKDKPVKLVKNVQENLPTVRADAIRVRQVLLNLLSNAAKFTSEGSITVDATVNSGPAGHPEILVNVTDTGTGIDTKDQTKLFQAFSQVDDSLTRKTTGSGLGLSISQQLIQMHGGRIGVHSALGKGSTFYFTLPTYRGKEIGPDAKNEKVILAIDDDPQVISLYERYLQPQGYQVVALTDSTQAKVRAKQLKPYAITLDIMMPSYDGWSVLNDLKSDAETRDIPVIVCSIVEDQERGFSLGAADYLLKPILEDDLLNALDRLNQDGSIRTVLIVDDNPSDLRLMEKILNEQGRYKAILAESGPKGWDIIVSRAAHAVILDLFMPEMDGFTILEKMRDDPKLRDIPVVVVSGVDLSAEQKQQLKEFGQRLLTKSGLNESELLSTVERALKRIEGKK
jgi:PAS domain S-box-containing protein